LAVIGLGPGYPAGMTTEALTALKKAEVVVGYKTYIKLVEPLLDGKEVISSVMKKEIERVKLSLELALAGKKVALISSGDPGVFGMAGPVLELAPEHLDISVFPGVTAASAAAAVLGAPLMHDFAVISLSDLLTPWPVIACRLEAAASADFVIALYNPRSRGRREHLAAARELVLRHRAPETVVGLVRNCGREGQQAAITTLAGMDVESVDMFTTVIIGSSRTGVIHGKMVTPRGYRR
jgi:precorrin-3B C17-methyltransferase